MRPRILMTAFRIPCPPTDGARLRILNVAKRLAERADVDLLVVTDKFHEERAENPTLGGLDEVFRDVKIVAPGPLRIKLAAARGILSRDPIQTHYYDFREAREWFRENHARYDLLWCQTLKFGRYFEGVDTPKVVDLVDAISMLQFEHAKRARGIWRCILPVEKHRTRAYERRLLDAFDRAFVISPHDRAYLEGVYGRACPQLRLLPNGVDDALFTARETPVHPNRIAFVGRMDYPPNEDAAIFFAREVLPRVRRACPGAEFRIVGGSPTRAVRALAKLPGVTVTGFVDDPRRDVEAAAVSVAPVRFGGGVQNKVLEALALGKPVVTSTVGARGLAGTPDVHYRVADAPADVAAAVVELIADADARAALGARGRDLIATRYRWPQIGKQLWGDLEDVIAAGRTRAPRARM